MKKQITLSLINDELSKARTKKKEFLEMIERIIPWTEWHAIIKPSYYKGERGNKPYELALMLRIYVLQNIYDLSDMATSEQIIDSRSFSQFCGIDSPNQVPDGDTIGRFRNILTKQGLQKDLFAQVVKALTEQKLILKKGTIVDSSIIAAPPSTKNLEKKRDPEASSTKKGTTWHFGYKAHIGADKDSGLVHHLEVTTAKEHDVTVTHKLLTGEEETVNGDSGYLGAEDREEAVIRNNKGRKIKYRINRRRSQMKHLSRSGMYRARKVEREKSSVRSKVEHVFGIIKVLFKYKKTRYRGLVKQTGKLHMMFALANLYKAQKFILSTS